MIRRRFLLSTVCALYFGVIIAATFVPPRSGNSSPFWPFFAFLLVGVLLVLLLDPRRWWAALGFSVLGSSWVEAAQSVWMPQFATIPDLIAGVIGSVLGVGIALLIFRLRRRSMRTSKPSRVLRESGREITQD